MNNTLICPKCGRGILKKTGRDCDTKEQRYRCNNSDCRKYIVEHIALENQPDNVDIELVIENVRLAKSKQRFQDSNRIERKSFREYARVDNALEEYNKELIKAITKHPLIIERHGSNTVARGAGIIHLSDLHFNEIVQLSYNKYDFNEASKRLKLLVDEAKAYFKAFGINNVLIAMTGDMLNSDRRLDEYLNNATNRANATALSVHLLKQVLEDLAQDYNVIVACVTGNESRANKEPGWSDLVATDNYDFTIFTMLRYLFAGTDAVSFALGDPTELVVNVAGQNILLLHGHSQQIQKDVESSVQKIKGKYVSRGVFVRYTLFGHLHSARLGDTYARSSSLVGSNDYSDKGLQLDGRASQNIYIVRENGNIDSIKIDLQDTDGITGYHIIDELACYNAKSAQLLHQSHAIMQVVI